MWDLDYTSQAEEIQALLNEPTNEELDDMVYWYESKGVAA